LPQSSLDLVDTLLSSSCPQDRILLLAELVPSIPSDQLHLIADLTPEAVLGTKEVNEKTRDAAFELVVLMGQKMAAGGVIKRSQVEGIDADSEMADEGESRFHSARC
jgi:ribosomal RNA-processing protein 12